MEEKILMMKTLRALREIEVITHLIEDHQEVEVVGDHQEVVVMEKKKVQMDHLSDCSNLQSPFKDHQEEESRSKPLTSLMEIESEPKYSLTNSIWCLKETQTNIRQMMPKLLWQCHISKD